MFRIEADTAALASALTDLAAKQLPYALRLAQNETGKAVVEGLKVQMRSVFDRPTPFTLNAFFVEFAKAGRPVMTVRRKDMVEGRHYLGIEEAGGARPQTGVERRLEGRAGFTGRHRHLVPGPGARLDRYGNMSQGQRNQVLSQVQAQRDSTANETSSSRSRKSKRERYFLIGGDDDSHLAPGVWERRGRSVVPIYLFVSAAPVYASRLAFERVTNEIAKARFPAELAAAMRKALATAR